MNIYFLVEGRRTEQKVYPAWLSHLVPQILRVKHLSDIKNNHYYLFNGGGYPSIYNHIQNALEEINEHQYIDYFVICIDADEVSVEERRQEILDYIYGLNIDLIESCKILVVVQNRCIETWFLGNPKIYKKNPQNTELSEWQLFFNVKEEDPELMGIPDDFEGNITQFHLNYLTAFLLERNISYTKNFPRSVVEKTYLDELVKRVNKTKHLSTLVYFIDFCEKINAATTS